MTPDRRELLHARLRPVPDFPWPGILFQDISPLLADPVAFAMVIEELVPAVAGADLLLAIDSRGFLLAAPLALRVGVGMAMVRKPGKLPGPTREVRYDLEYGSDALQVQRDALWPGQRVLIVDDVLATGGTAAAAVELVTGAGADVAGVAVLLELAGLDGRSALDGVAVTALLRLE